MRQQPPREQDEVSAQMDELVQRRDDLLDLVLRGHLMVEQMLARSILPWFPQTASLNEAKLGFFQKLCLVRALNVRHPQEPMWRALTALNALRNDFAHRLTSKERDQKVRQFLEATDLDLPIPEEKREKEKDLTDHQQLALALTYLLSSLNQIRIEYESRATIAHTVGEALLYERYGWKGDRERPTDE